MDIYIIIIIIILAFWCEFFDSSFGMGYGTIMAPVLILFGFEIFLVITSILFSEMLSSLCATIFHHEMDICNLGIKETNIKVVTMFTILCVISTIISVIIVLHIPKIFIEAYIRILVIFIGLILLIKKKYSFSWRKLGGLSIISAFNKMISGGGLGPILTTGQILSGREVKQSIGVTKATKFIVSIAGFFTFYILHGITDYTLIKILTITGTFAAFLGIFSTKRIRNQNKARFLIGIIAIILGLFLLGQIIIWNF